MKNIFLSKLWMVLFGLFVFASCNQNETTEAEAETFVEETVFRMQESGNLGRFGCYELSFPITVTYPDGSVSEEIDSYAALKEILKAWRLENGRTRVRPVITLPFDVINEDGEVITIETADQLKRLRMECRKTFFENHGPGGHDGRGKFCFRLQYPLSLEFPNGNTQSFDNKRAMYLALRAWKRANPGSDVRPVLVFPINVVMEDGTVVTVNSKEDLKALKEGCN